MSEGKSVLVVEDDQMVRELVVLMLEGAGYAATAVHDVASAEQYLDSRAQLAVLLTDQNLSSAGAGIELIWRMRRCGRDIPAILMTGVAEQIDELPPATMLLAKPFSRNQVIAALEQACKPW